MFIYVESADKCREKKWEHWRETQFRGYLKIEKIANK